MNRSPEIVAKGVRGSQRGTFLRTVVALDPEVHEQIATLARGNNTSFAEQVRILVELGLDFDSEV